MSEHNGRDGVAAGLEGIVAAETQLSLVDGERGYLIIGGYPVEVIAERATFEEVSYLLWRGERPNQSQLKQIRSDFQQARELSDITISILRQAAGKRRPVMDVLRMAAATLDLDMQAGEAGSDAASFDALSVRIAAQMPVIVAAYWRLLQGEEPVKPDSTLGHAANYLYMLTGDPPSDATVRGMETYLNTVVDHGLNASTFAARVIISTHSDLVSAVTGAIGALKGPLHGGAPGPALDMVFEIGEASRAEPYLRAKLERGERLMGFGHRVYKVRDPRAEVLGRAASALFEQQEEQDLYSLVRHVEEVAVRLLEEYKPGRRLQTNVEFYTALLLHGLGLETDLFSPTFAVSRTVGWIAHCREQLAAGRILRPQSTYVGEIYDEWTPLAEQS